MIYDMLIIGGGPAGFTAALYAARAGLRALVLEEAWAGGQMALAHRIDNYPGFPGGVDGVALSLGMQKGAEKFGAETVNTEVKKLDLRADPKSAETDAGVYYGKTVVLATGASPRALGLPGEKELLGRGVSYCAACDGNFFKDKKVAVVGGGNTAAGDALHLSRVAETVIIIHRRDSLRAEQVSGESLQKAPNVSFLWHSQVAGLLYGDKLSGVRIKNLLTGEEREEPCDGLFVSIGRRPASELVSGQLALDEGGYIIGGENTETSLPGVYAAGDVRTKQLRQIVTAVADGAMAVHQAVEYLGKK